MTVLKKDPNKGLDFWYDGQIRRFMIQLVALFSQFSFEYKDPKTGEKTLRRVPCKFASRSRQYASILKNNSENTMLSIPAMSVYITDFQPDYQRQQDPFFIDKQHATEQKYDDEIGSYVDEPGSRYTVERYMPQPFNLSCKLDIWTSNETQKWMLIEQLTTSIFKRSQDLYDSENIFDWTALKIIYLENITYSSKTFPISSGNEELDIASMSLKCPVWINPPAKIKPQNLIKNILMNVNDTLTEPEIREGETAILDTDDDDLFIRKVLTYNENMIEVDGRTITLLGCSGSEIDENGNIFPWIDLFDRSNTTFRPGISQIAINLDDTPGHESKNQVIGNVDLHPNEPNKLVWSINPMTLPANTLDPINALIDPKKTFPGNGISLSPNIGDRYIITEDQGVSEAWGDLQANANDIIQYTENGWRVAFNAKNNLGRQEVLVNEFTGEQLLWAGKEWQLAISGVYRPGFWSIKY